MKIASLSHQGLVRINNEDAVLVDTGSKWVALADGMGGLLAGEEASDVAVTAAGALLGNETVDDIEAILFNAHDQVKNHARAKNYVGKMGTTLVLWRWCEGKPEFCHVGDSRIYAFDGQILEQLSHDHTVAQRMVDEGVVPQEEAHTAPHQNVLTQALGMPGTLKPQAGGTPNKGKLLLCSDGLSDLVAHESIEAILKSAEDLEDCAKALVKSALDCGGRDNVTVALIDLD